MKIDKTWENYNNECLLFGMQIYKSIFVFKFYDNKIKDLFLKKKTKIGKAFQSNIRICD